MGLDRFYKMVDRVPRVSHLWDRSKDTLKHELLERELGVMSPGECHMALFFVSVWRGKNVYGGFDLVDAVSRLDVEHRKIIIEWIANPFWP